VSRAGRCIGAALLLTLASCGPGSQQDRPVSEPTFDAARMQITELEALLWPKAPDQWQPLTEAEQLALEQLVTALLGHAQRGKLSARQLRRMTKLARTAGLELHAIALEHDGRVEPLWVLLEPPERRHGRGSYVFRLGPLEPEGPPTEYLLQAPHSRYDKHTGIIALTLFVEADGRPPRALFVNSVHRYAQADGTRGKRTPAHANPADASHREDHPLARATARALQEHALALVQLHGFEHDAEAGDPEIIISSGRKQPTTADTGTIDRLRAGFPQLAVGHFGVDVTRLGATTNVQGHAARASRRCFVHVEASETFREQLRSDRETRRIFAIALFGGGAEELHAGCP
jgi:hypothetical protein